MRKQKTRKFTSLLLTFLMVFSGTQVITSASQPQSLASQFSTYSEHVNDEYLPPLSDDFINAYNILTSTLNGSVGVQGFVGDYAITCPNEIVEIVVQFVTPPSVALRLMQENGIPQQRIGRALPAGSFEEQALSAHNMFNQQLNSIAMPFSGGRSANAMEIFSEHHRLLNGVFMRVPGYMVWVIASLPEVFAVTPNITFYTAYDLDRMWLEYYLQNQYGGQECPYYTEDDAYPCDEDDGLEQYPYYPEDEEFEPEQCPYCSEDEIIPCSECSEPEQCPYYPEEEDVKDENYYKMGIADINPTSTQFVVYENFMRTVREYFDMYNIHTTMGLTGAGVRVAVLDTGIYHTHPEFANFLDETGRIRGRGHYIEGNAPPHNPMHRGRNHGTTVSGAVIAMAPGVELWHYRVALSGMSGMHPLAGIEAAHEDGMDVVNMSFGGGNVPFDPMSRAVNTAALDGVVMVVAAGNRGNAYFSVSTPATASLGIAVGAGSKGSVLGYNVLGHVDTLMFYSSRGPLFIVNHIKPDIIAPTHVVTTDLYGGYTASSGGTSHAAPIIAGIAALLIEAFPNATPYEIKARMMNTARQLADVEMNSVFTVGAGFVQPYYALTNRAIVTARHYVPVTASHLLPYELATMASLSFGGVNLSQVGNLDKTIPVSIRNTGDTTATYTISYMFARNNGGAASINLSTTSVTVAPGGTGQFDVTMLISSSAYTGFYEGYIYINDGPVVVARLPFGAVVDGEFLLSVVRVYNEEQLREAILQTAPIYALTVIEVAADIILSYPHIRIPVDVNIHIRSADGYIHKLERSAVDWFWQPFFSLFGNLTLENIKLVRTYPIPEIVDFATAVYIRDSGYLTMLDGTVISGHHRAGIINEGTFTMIGGEITGNGSLGYGVDMRWFATTNMYGGIISGNPCGGVSMAGGGTFNMHGGGISGNSSLSANNGGVFISGSHSSNYVAVFNMHDGKISDNASIDGGGITIRDYAVFNMYGGEVSGNTAENYGGGILFTGRLATVNIYGGEISGNTANNGGGIATDTIDNIRAGRLRIGPDAVFAGNVASRAFNRLPADDDMYYEFINATRWSHPFTQGFNNFDIQYTYGTEIPIRTLDFQLNGTPTNPTDQLQIEPINVLYSFSITIASVLPSNPTRLGYIFAGWYLDSGFTQRLSQNTLMPDADTTLYARWHNEEQMRILSFNLNDTTTNPSNPLQITPLYVRHNTQITQAYGFPTNPTRLGYTFTGWYLNNGLTQEVTQETLMLTDKIIYASWEVLLPRIRFYFNTPDFYEYVEIQLEGVNQPIPSHLRPTVPIRYGTPGNPGWAFLGWYEELFPMMHNPNNYVRTPVNHAQRLAAIDLLSNIIITQTMLDVNGVLNLHASWVRFGDLNDDGIIDPVDRSLMQNRILGSITEDGIIMQTANLNPDEDNIVDPVDRSLLQNHILGAPGIILGHVRP